jgi:tetratricopeptide (TPR) repeat protein
MRVVKGFAFGCILICLAVSSLARADPPATLEASPSAQELADAAVVKAAMAAVGENGPLGLQKHAAALRTVLDHAPASYPEVVRAGNTVIVRADSGEIAPEALIAAAGVNVSSGKVVLRIEYNTYPTAALLLASFAVEAERPDLALPYLDRGLAMQPGNSNLTSEKAHSLYKLHRTAEGLSLVETWLAAHPLAPALDRARMLRSKGFGLTELDRLDEAEKAYQESLTLQPGHALALNELKYIQGLRAGRAKAPVESITSDKAVREAPRPSNPPPPKNPT